MTVNEEVAWSKRLRTWAITAATVTCLSLASISTYAAVGRTQGSFAVSPSGAASYNIPLFAPPGPRGMQPHIALAYNSNGGVGPLGRGWGIAGLSSISRCDKTYAQDSSPAVVSLAVSDGYCLNGNRLRLTFGSYGVAGSQYQTEIADFSLVTAVGGAGNGPSSFIVQGRDGLTYEYGGTPDSRVLASGTQTAIIWMLDLITDRSGNKLKFTYKLPDGATSGTTDPVSIEWTATSLGAATYLYKMSFSYGANAPPSSKASRIAGTPVFDSNLLTAITVSNSGVTKRKYFLGYETSPTTAAFRLDSVTECSDDAGVDCLQPTSVVYQDGQKGVSTTGTVAMPNADYVYTRFDLNGDGFKDLVYLTGGFWYVKFGSATGYGAPVSTGLQGGVLIGDVRGNGKDGILAAQGSTLSYYIWNGTSFDATATSFGLDGGNYAVLADVNGDGLPDLVTFVGATSTLNYRLNTSTPSTVNFSSLQLGVSLQTPAEFFLSSDTVGIGQLIDGRSLDFNGDGLPDFAVGTSLTYTWYDPLTGSPIQGRLHSTSALVSTGSGAFTVAGLDTFQDDTGTQGPRIPTFLDINDDKCTDVAIGATLTISGCGGVATTIAYPSNAVAVLDWNGDGRSDVLGVDNGALVIYLSNGTGFNGGVPTGLPNQVGVWRKMDATGDGLDSLAFLSLQGSSHPFSYFVHNSPGVTPDLATKFQDGFGVMAAPTYRPLLLSGYAIANDAVFPNKPFAGPLNVVTSVSASDLSGTPGATYNRGYYYAMPWTNAQGRGFQGFYVRQSRDDRSGQYVKELYRRDFPFSGLALETDRLQSDGVTPISQSFYTYVTLNNALQGGGVNNQRYFPKPIQTVTNQFEVGGAKNGQQIATQTTVPTFDPYGNAVGIVTTLTDTDIDSPYRNLSWTTTRSMSITPDIGANWCLTQPTQTQEVRTAPAAATGTGAVSSITRTVSYSPDYVSCRPTNQVIAPGDGLYQVTTAWLYDGFGNIRSSAVTGVGMTPRTTLTDWGATGQFPSSITNPLNQTTQFGYDSGVGVLSSVTTANSGSNTTSWVSDSFGRLQRENRPDGTYTVYSLVAPGTGVDPRAAYGSQASFYGIDNAVSRTETHYLDAFDRSVVEFRTALTGGYVATARGFDSRGRKVWEGIPFQSGGVTQYTPNYSASYAFDELNRVVQISRPLNQGNPSASAVTGIAYAGRTQITTDPQGKSSTKIFKVVGAIGVSKDHDGYSQSFGHDAFGSLLSVKDSIGNTLFGATYVYGVGAFQTQVTDMDLGVRNYDAIDALGEVTHYSDAKGQSFSMTYDPLSRPQQRVEPDLTTTWTWGADPASHNIGQLSSVGDSNGYTESYSYDAVGRLSSRQISVPGDQSYGIDVTYNSQGQLDTYTFPPSPTPTSSRVALKYGYQAGRLKSVQDFTGGSLGVMYWQATGQGPWGQVSTESLGNGIVTTRAFDGVTGWVNSIQSGVGGGAGVQNQSVSYDAVGNVTLRQDNFLGLNEYFYYDNLYRLSYSQLGGATNLAMGYDVMGNVTSRSDINGGAAWSYDPVRKHAVLQAGTPAYTYTYDANGNVTSRQGFAIAWTSANYPKAINGAGKLLTFSYGPDRSRYRQDYLSGSSTESTIYVGGALEKVSAGGIVDWRHYVKVGSQTVAIISRPSSGASAAHYVLEDTQSSIAKLLDNVGGTVVSESFAAFGGRRDPASWTDSCMCDDLSKIKSISRRGYTGHEAIGGVSMGLIHMNGRVLDSITGRFLSPDPNIQNPLFTQSYNRYSYVNNNPMSYVDPTGFEVEVTDIPCDQNDPEQVCQELGISTARNPQPAACPTYAFCVDKIPEGFFQPFTPTPGDGGPGASGASGGPNDAPGPKPPTPPKPPTDDQCHSPPISPAESAAADRGDTQSFWSSRLERKDPLAETALSIVNNDFGLGAFANGRLFSAILNRDEQSGHYQGLAEIKAEMKDISVELMLLHVQTVNNLGGATPVQVADYHFQDFDKHDLPRDTFGGAPLTGTDADVAITAWLWIHCP